MELGLKNKVALVTGASKGIGRAIAIALAREGCCVVVSARNREDLKEVVEEIEKTGEKAIAVAADLTKSDEIEKLVDETVRQLGTIHILVNNAGTVGSFSPFAEISPEEWQQVFNLNLFANAAVTHAVLPQMQQQQWGRIINIASESGIQPDPDMSHYNCSKAAIINLTKSLSKAYADDGILVNTVSPAVIRTPMLEEVLQKQADSQNISLEEAETDFLQENRPNLVLKRAGKPEEVASVVVFLASTAASFITGSNYRVDGGSVASI